MIKSELCILVEMGNVAGTTSIVYLTENCSREDIEYKIKDLESQIEVALADEDFDLADIL